MSDAYGRETAPPPSGGNSSAVAIIAIFVIAVLVALLVWRPWSLSPTRNPTNITQPTAAPAETSENYTPAPAATYTP